MMLSSLAGMSTSLRNSTRSCKQARGHPYATSFTLGTTLAPLNTGSPGGTRVWPATDQDGGSARMAWSRKGPGSAADTFFTSSSNRPRRARFDSRSARSTMLETHKCSPQYERDSHSQALPSELGCPTPNTVTKGVARPMRGWSSNQSFRPQRTTARTIAHATPSVACAMSMPTNRPAYLCLMGTVGPRDPMLWLRPPSR